MKIDGKDWMEWLHKVRYESQKQRKRTGRSLAKHLKLVEGKASTIKTRPQGVRKEIKTGSGRK